MSKTCHKYLLLTNHKTYDKLYSFISKNQDSVLGMIGYSSCLLAELVKHYPSLKKLIYKILYRLKIVTTLKSNFTLSEGQNYWYGLLRSLYGYIVDIRIAACVFNIIPYISEFLKMYNSPRKLYRNLNSYDKVIEFLQYGFLFNYQIYELFGFLTSHDLLDRDFISKYFLLKKHREDKGYDKSDYLYVYSCKFWYFYNIVTVFDTAVVKRKSLDWHLLVDTLFSYHWSLKNGLLNREQFAVIGFIHTFDKFKKLLN